MKREKQKIEEISTCPDCDGTHLIKDYSRAELVCEECGLVIDSEIIDQGPEWRAFDNDQREKKSRTGSPMTYRLHDKGLSTIIDWKNRDSYGRSIPPKNRAQLFRLRKTQRRIRISNATERNLSIALSGLDRLASSMNLPRTVRETAAMIYRKAVIKKLVRGRTIEGILAASLYAACRQCNVPRSLDEISKNAGKSKKEIGRTYRYISNELALKLMPTVPEDYISRFCSILKLSANVRTMTLNILQDAATKELTSGRGPTGMAAASLYIATVLAGERVTQTDIARVAGVTEVTIRNRYKEILDKLQIEFPL